MQFFVHIMKINGVQLLDFYCYGQKHNFSLAYNVLCTILIHLHYVYIATGFGILIINVLIIDLYITFTLYVIISNVVATKKHLTF